MPNTYLSTYVNTNTHAHQRFLQEFKHTLQKYLQPQQCIHSLVVKNEILIIFFPFLRNTMTRLVAIKQKTK